MKEYQCPWCSAIFKNFSESEMLCPNCSQPVNRLVIYAEPDTGKAARYQPPQPAGTIARTRKYLAGIGITVFVLIYFCLWFIYQR